MNEIFVVIVRGIIGFFTLLIFTRIIGKQQISQLTFFDYVLGITIGSTASTLTTDLSSNVLSEWSGLSVWVILGIFMQFLTLKSKHAKNTIEGQPNIVVLNGKIMEDCLKQMQYTLSDLLEQLRVKGVFDLEEIQCAILESNGELSIMKKSEYDNITKKDLNIKYEKVDIPIELIYDGNVVYENLKQLNKDDNWLKIQLGKKGIKNFNEVFLASINKNNSTLYIDTYKDHLNNTIDIVEYGNPSDN